MRPILSALALLALTAASAPGAFAADLGGPSVASMKDDPPNSPSIWAGPYYGIGIGYGGGDSEAREINGPRNFITSFDGLTGSAHVGWQRQFGRVILGGEFEAGYLGMGSSITRDVAGGTVTSGADLGAYAALTGRFGVLVRPDWLLYGRAGIVAAELDGHTTQTCTDGTLCGGAQSTAVSRAEADSPAWGLLLGAGVERRLDRHWSARLEYRYMTFRDELALPAIDGPGWEHNIDVHAVSFGLSYRF